MFKIKKFDMKKNLLLTAGFALFAIGAANSQCTITGLNPTACIGDAPLALTGTDFGYFSGPGITGNVFDPTVAGVGTHAINFYQLDPAPTTYTVDQSGTYGLIAGTGTTISLSDDQVTPAMLPIGFTFNFFGTDYTTFNLSSNGFITFNADLNSACCSGQAIPNAASPNNFIAWSWDDMYPPGAGSIQYFVTGTAPYQMLVINFFDIPFCCGTVPAVKSQIVLYESTNIITINTEYATGVNPGTMGIEDATGATGFSVPGRNGAAWPNLTNDFVAFIPAIICTATEMITVNDVPTVTGAVDFSTVCENDTVIFTGSGTDTYIWDNGVTDGAPYVATASGAFTVTGTDGTTGCSNTDVVMLTVNPAPIVGAGVDLDPVCEGTTVIFTGSGADSYSWDNGVTDGVGFVATTSGTFTVTGTEAVNGCTNTASVNLTVNLNPSITLTPTDELIGNDGTVTSVVTGSGPFTYDWDNDGTGDFDDASDITGLVAGTYTLVVQDANGCSSTDFAVVSSQVGIEGNTELNFSVYPNPTNGQFSVNINSGLSLDNVSIQIVNSLGQIVVSQKVISNNTAFDLRNQEAGVYYIKVISENGTQISSIVIE